MTFLVQKTRGYVLTINGEDYSSKMVSWVASDASAYKQGFMTTTGSLVLSSIPGGALMEDYDRNNLRRGAEVILDIIEPGGSQVRHPRGLLYVISTSYDVESADLVVELGCQLALRALVDQYEDLISGAPLPIDPVRESLGNISASYQAAGKVFYQDNQGNLVSRDFFGTDTVDSAEEGAWVSVLGKTAESVQPLAASSPIPDEINLAYQSPYGDGSSGDRVDITTTESHYFVSYPAVIYERTGSGLSTISSVQVVPASSGVASGCGNTPPAPIASVPTSCNAGYTLNQTPRVMAATKLEVNTTEYDGPAGQVSRVHSITRGPALEANSQYFADKFAFCRYTWSTACNPNGGCPFDGMTEIVLRESITTNYYGSAGELVRTITDEYLPTLAGAQPFDWRSGVINGAPQDFQDLSLTAMYRVQRTDNQLSVVNNSNIQETTTYQSSTTLQGGINAGNIDALDGVRTFQRRSSTTISTNPVAPDIIIAAETNTTEATEKLRLFGGRYQEPPASGPYIAQEQIPIPLLLPTEAAVRDAVNKYSFYLTKFTKGDALGLQIGESLRPEIVDGWVPGMPFRYWDTRNDKLLAMRMDACQWGVDARGAAVVTSGIWIGTSDGVVILPNNVVGNPALTPGGPPFVSDETVVNNGALVFNIDVHMTLENLMGFPGNDGTYYPAPAETTLDNYQTLTVWVTGVHAEPGAFYQPEPDGGIPVNNPDGQLISGSAVILDDDLFAA